MAGGGIEIKKLSLGQIQALYRAYCTLIRYYEVENDHELLLLHHAQTEQEEFFKMMNKKQKQYTLKLPPLRALAFCQLWNVNLEFLGGYERNVINHINAVIDKHRKQINTQPYEPTH